MRLCAALLAGCAPSAAVHPPAPRKALPATPPAERAQAPFELDTSIATVWGIDPHRPLETPPAREDREDREDREHVAVPVPRPRREARTRRAPCFPNRDVLVASEVYRDLQAYVAYYGADAEPPNAKAGRYGTCTIKNAQLRDEHGSLVGEIGCGLSIYVPGVIDEVGFEVGARGSDVATEYETTSSDMVCLDMPDQSLTWCWFVLPDGQRADYAMRARITEPLRGSDAIELFARSTVTAIAYTGGCH